MPNGTSVVLKTPRPIKSQRGRLRESGRRLYATRLRHCRQMATPLTIYFTTTALLKSLVTTYNRLLIIIPLISIEHDRSIEPRASRSGARSCHILQPFVEPTDHYNTPRCPPETSRLDRRLRLMLF